MNPRNSTWGFPIIDFHLHLPVEEDFTAEANAAYIAVHGQDKFAKLRADWLFYQQQWWDRYGFGTPEQTEHTPQHQAQRWAQEIDQAGIEAGVFVTGGGNHSLSEAIAEHPRLMGFAHHSPFAPDAAAELRRAVQEEGMRGYKVFAPALPGPIDHEDLHPVWQVAEDLQIPVLIHFGPLEGGGGTAWHTNINPLMLHDVAKAFTYTTFVIPHFGCGYPKEMLHLAWACRNVCVDTSGNNEWVRWMSYRLSLSDLFTRFYETIGPQRIIFGSDSSWFPRGLVGAYYEEQIAVVDAMGIDDAARHQIFYANAARLLKWHD